MAATGVTGLVLAGGRGSRMGGVDKGLALYRGEPLVAHAIARLAPQVDAIVISANRNSERYATFGVPVVADADDEFRGPLAGIRAGLAVCATGRMLAVPCDAPHLPLDLAARLSAAFRDADIDAATVETGVRAHPVFCLVDVRVAAALDAFLDAGGRSVRAWLGRVETRAVSFDDDAAFRNINTLDALRATH